MTAGLEPATVVAGRGRAPVRFNPFSAEFRRDPYPMYRGLRETRPVHKTMGMWVLTRHADVRAVLRDRSFSAGLIPDLVGRQASRDEATDPAAVGRIRRLGEKSLVFTDNPEHARLRGLVNPVFTPQAIAALRPQVERTAAELLARALRDGGMDAVADFAAPLPLTVLSDWMDLPADLRDQVGQWTHEVRFLLEPGLMSGADFSRVAAVVETFAAMLAELVAERRVRPGDDLISRLGGAVTGGGDRLSDEEAAFVAIMCFVAGHETTKSLIGNGLLALLRHPEQEHRLRSRPDLVPTAVGEALRYDSPLQMTKRLATRDIEIGGQQVSAGDQLLLCLGAANRDPDAFDRPDELDVGRETDGHLAFGFGMHGCLGGLLASLQAEAAFGCLYRSGTTLRAEPGLDFADLEWQDHSFIVRGLKRLPVSFHGPTEVPSRGSRGGDRSGAVGVPLEAR
ncbi:MAG TPA: cytochrome P450 [Trebonia sp.]